MYIPHYYKNENIEEVHEFIRQNSFGILINQVNGKPWGTHIPLELEKQGEEYVLTGHIAKANPQWKNFESDSEVLCIFNGPHAYVSSSVYREEEVPTWNYIAVHVYGRIKILNAEETLAAMHRLVDRYEASSEQPLSLHDLSPKTLRQINGVVGFSIHISDINAAYKLSQTRPEDHEAIINTLKKQGAAENEIARHIEQQSNHQ